MINAVSCMVMLQKLMTWNQNAWLYPPQHFTFHAINHCCNPILCHISRCSCHELLTSSPSCGISSSWRSIWNVLVVVQLWSHEFKHVSMDIPTAPLLWLRNLHFEGALTYTYMHIWSSIPTPSRRHVISHIDNAVSTRVGKHLYPGACSPIPTLW